MSVGQDLLDVPFPQMVQGLAFAIAKGQMELDKTSIETARRLALENVDVVTQIAEVIEPDPFTPQNSPVQVTGARVRFTSRQERMSLMQAGLLPTFYQFTESIIEVKMSISQKSTSTTEFEAGASVGGSANFFFGSATFSAHVNFRSQNTYSYSVEGSSLLRTTLKPVPPPGRLTPRIITVNTLVQPPVVSFS
jgi:hypothetical protein